MATYNKMIMISARHMKEKYRYSLIMLKELVKTDFKLRYQSSALGYLWSLLRPLFMFTILYLVFVKFLKIGNQVEHPAVYLLLGIVLWNFFVEVTSGSIGAIVGKGDVIRKINFPKYVIILAIMASALINLALNAIVITLFMILNGVHVTWSAFLIVPLLFELCIISLGFAFLLSALFVKLRDVSYIWDVVTQAGFYLTPIFYLVTVFPTKIAQILILSPLAQIIQDARYALVTHQSPTIATVWDNWMIWLVPILSCVVIFIIGVAYFRSRSQSFAEDV